MGDSALSVALRAHVTENEPPPSLDAAGILASGRRSVLRRRLIGGVAFVLTVALAVAVTTAWLPDPDRSAPVAAGEFTTVEVGRLPLGGMTVMLPEENPRSQPTVWMSLAVSPDGSGSVYEAAEIQVSLAYSGEQRAAVERCVAAVGAAKPCERRTGQDGETIIAFTGPVPGDASVEVYAGSTKVLLEPLPVYQSLTGETSFFTKDRMVWLAMLPALRLFP